MGKFGKCCCTVPPPPYREEKRLIVIAPFHQFFIGDSSIDTRYLRRVDTTTNISGSRVDTTTFDPDNATNDFTRVESPGFSLGAPGFSFVRSYALPYTVSDWLAKWQPRLEAWADIEDFNQPTEITNLELFNGSVFVPGQDVIIDFWSVLTNAGADDPPANCFNALYIRANVTAGYPWNGEWEASGDVYENPYAEGADAAFGIGGATLGMCMGTGVNSTFAASSTVPSGILIQTCQAFPVGANCDAPDYRDQEFVAVSGDESDGTNTATWGITLDPGYYSFNGYDYKVHSGDLSGGIDPQISGNIGYVSWRDYQDPPFNIIGSDEVCP